MRITILNQFYLPDISPTAHLAASLAEHRAALADKVTVVASRGGYVDSPGAGLSGHSAANPRVIRVWTPKLGKSRKLFRIADYAIFYLGAALRLLVLPRQDLIVALTTPPFIVAVALLHKLLHRRTKVILWNMDCYPEVAERTGVIREHGFLSRVMRALNRGLFGSIDQFICLDPAMRQLLNAHYAPIGRELRSAIIPNWERASFFPAAAAPASWNEIDLLGLREKFVILYLGNTGYGHEFNTVLEAARVLANDPVAFLFVGGGSRWAEIEAAAQRMGLANVIMRGYVSKDQTPSVMGSAACALITLQDFALGVMSPSKLHSNLAMGLPIIYVGPKDSNVDEAIARFDCGVSARRGESSKLVEWIRAAMTTASSHNAMRIRARQAFDDAYCDIRTLPRFDAIIEALAPPKPFA